MGDPPREGANNTPLYWKKLLFLRLATVFPVRCVRIDGLFGGGRDMKRFLSISSAVLAMSFVLVLSGRPIRMPVRHAVMGWL